MAVTGRTIYFPTVSRRKTILLPDSSEYSLSLERMTPHKALLKYVMRKT